MAMPATMCKSEEVVRELCAHSYVFICGLFHSGTGTLRRAIASVAPQRTSIHSGTNRIEDEGKYMQTVYPVNHERDARLWHCAFAESKRIDDSRHPPHSAGSLALDEVDAANAAPRGSSLLFAQWARWWDLSRPILVEKSPMNMLRTRYLDALFPEMASFAAIIRHPFGACTMQLKAAFKALLAPPLEHGGSGARRGRAPRVYTAIFDRLRSILDAWLDLYAQYERDTRPLARATLVRFEALLANPDQAARRVLLALGMQPDRVHGRALNLDKHTVGIDASHAHRWYFEYADRFAELKLLTRAGSDARAPSPAWDALVEQYEPLLRRYGYSLRNMTILVRPDAPIVCA
jgi:hypothetical protein